MFLFHYSQGKIHEVPLRHKEAMLPQGVHHGLNICNDTKIFDPIEKSKSSNHKLKMELVFKLGQIITKHLLMGDKQVKFIE